MHVATGIPEECVAIESKSMFSTEVHAGSKHTRMQAKGLIWKWN